VHVCQCVTITSNPLPFTAGGAHMQQRLHLQAHMHRKLGQRSPLGGIRRGESLYCSVVDSSQQYYIVCIIQMQCGSSRSRRQGSFRESRRFSVQDCSCQGPFGGIT
jgi:hypothetical protein